jgi:DNA-binding CsgD family transcriptional regulator
MRDLPISQSWFFMQMTIFFRKTIQPIIHTSGDNKSLKWYINNFTLKPPKKPIVQISLVGHCLDFTDNGSILMVMMVMKNINSLVKSKDIWWAEFNVNNGNIYSFHSSDKKFVNTGILSQREMEILQLMGAGNDTKAVADKICLSPFTVDTHKKNMLLKLGAKDTSSLLLMCKNASMI